MATLVGTEKDLNELLEKLIELDYDAAEAYEASIERLEDAESKSKLEEFREDHLRHTRELGEILRESGRTPPAAGDIKRVLTKGKVMIGTLGGDKAILMAMKTNEDDTNQAYERAVKHESAPPRVREVLQRNLGDERRHRAWIEQKMSSM